LLFEKITFDFPKNYCRGEIVFCVFLSREPVSLSEKLNHPKRTMLVLPSGHRRHQANVRSSLSSTARYTFDVDVMHDELGLRLVRIGEESPLRVLAAIEPMLVGVAEVGDSIVAINGISAKEAYAMFDQWDDSDRFEIAIFDHRTRRTVLWNLDATNLVSDSLVGRI
jgi:hypothetical protein